MTNAAIRYSMGLGLGITVLSSLLYLYYKFARKETVPKKWKRVGTLQNIYFYPIKSCASIDLTDDPAVFCEVLGLRKGDIIDRSLMLIDENGTLVSVRTYPKMLKIRPNVISQSKIILSAPGMEDSLNLDFVEFRKNAAKKVRTNVWGTEIDAMFCGNPYDAWFSQFILGKNRGLQLVYYPHQNPTRPVQKRLQKESVQNKDTFRGNFHLKMDNAVAFAEDNWKWVKIGNETIFRVVAPCARCIVININPYSAERASDSNPLKTLRTYRKWKNHSGPIMGIHLGIRTAGSIKAQDIIYVEDTSVRLYK